jgi:predicted aspartyl protease
LTSFDYIDENGSNAKFEGCQISNENPNPGVRALLNNTSGYSILLPVVIGDIEISAVVDTAAQVSVMSQSTCTRLGLTPQGSPTTIQTAESGAALQCTTAERVCITIAGDN